MESNTNATHSSTSYPDRQAPDPGEDPEPAVDSSTDQRSDAIPGIGQGTGDRQSLSLRVQAKTNETAEEADSGDLEGPDIHASIVVGAKKQEEKDNQGQAEDCDGEESGLKLGKENNALVGIVSVPVKRRIGTDHIHTGSDLALIEKQTTQQPVYSTPMVGLVGYSEDGKEVVKLHPMQAALLILGLTKHQQFDVHNSKLMLILIGIGIYSLADIGAIKILRKGSPIEDSIFHRAHEQESFDLFGFHDVMLGVTSFEKSKSSRLSVTTRHCKRGIKHLTRLKAEYGLYKRIRRHEKKVCGDDPEKMMDSGKEGQEAGVDFHILITMLVRRLHLKESSRNHYRKVAKVTALSLAPLGLMNKFTPSGAKTCFVISRLGALVRQTLINDIIKLKGLRPIVEYPPLPFYIYVSGADLMVTGALIALDGKAVSSICFEHPRSKLLTAGLIEPFLDPAIFKSVFTDITRDNIDTNRGQELGFYSPMAISVRRIILLGAIVGPVAVMRARLGIQWWRYVLTPPVGIFKRQMALFKNKSAVDKL